MSTTTSQSSEAERTTPSPSLVNPSPIPPLPSAPPPIPPRSSNAPLPQPNGLQHGISQEEQEVRRKISQLNCNGPEVKENHMAGPELPKTDRRMSVETQSRFDSSRKINRLKRVLFLSSPSDRV